MGRRLSFFHGTNVDLEPGAYVLPPEVTGAPVVHPARDRPEGAVFASSSERLAWNFAHRSAHLNARGTGLRSMEAPGGTGRGRVYRVEATDDEGTPIRPAKGIEHRRHPEYSGTNNQEWVAPAFRVLERLDIAPPAKKRWHAGGPGQGRSRWLPETRGNQGTLPLDWTPFAHRHPADVNHPHPDRIEAQELLRREHFEQGTLGYPTDPRLVAGQHPLPGLEPGGKLTRGLRKGRRRK